MIEIGECNKAVFAMDALFGLPRKKSAGCSFRPPLFEDLFFYNQQLLDQFVEETGNKKCGRMRQVSP